MNKVILCLTALFLGLAPARAEDIYLFYNAASDNLDELDISKKETAKILTENLVRLLMNCLTKSSLTIFMSPNTLTDNMFLS